ncbi:flagellar biosynthesis anti-sigma factor FlgM [Pseudomonas citronellolis]|uniref:flagellar biosynthesis anti-sigma factor FlgM n=1 Tax=Pseudomonas citronellolis TaxID=53408 RepID=UPI0023E3C6CB|nr:flagellar biosynthesis anti-sigma factor FlgM [Pseudomonas citronellolis]MDF3933850.1 flagellar biosynthesis anti-sigma factor FlgM [Pseudomonas citronellolis]
MEITRQLKSAVSAAQQSVAPQRGQRSDAAKAAVAPAGNANASAGAALPLEQLQDALGALPDVDLDKVAAVRDALARGEISLDVEALSRSMLDFHGGGA